MKSIVICSLMFGALALVPCSVSADQAQAAGAPASNSGDIVPTGVAVPNGYVIGPEDVLSIVFWRDKEMSAEVVVRPDGMISLPLLNDIRAAGSTPDQLRAAIVKAASVYIEDPNATVVLKAINSRKVFITGQVAKPGAYQLISDTTVVQLIAQAGGLLEYANDKNILITRPDGERTQRFKFNYRDFVKGKDVDQNLALKPGDTVIVP